METALPWDNIYILYHWAHRIWARNIVEYWPLWPMRPYESSCLPIDISLLSYFLCPVHIGASLYLVYVNSHSRSFWQEKAEINASHCFGLSGGISRRVRVPTEFIIDYCSNITSCTTFLCCSPPRNTQKKISVYLQVNRPRAHTHCAQQSTTADYYYFAFCVQYHIYYST